MGASLDDKIVQGNASGADWRTAALMGARLSERNLHDGRAATLRDAVPQHGGQSERVRFFQLNESEQKEIDRFMAAL